MKCFYMNGPIKVLIKVTPRKLNSCTFSIFLLFTVIFGIKELIFFREL